MITCVGLRESFAVTVTLCLRLLEPTLSVELEALRAWGASRVEVSEADVDAQRTNERIAARRILRLLSFFNWSRMPRPSV